MTARVRCGGSGFTLWTEHDETWFAQRVSYTMPNLKEGLEGRMVLNLFELFGDDGVANKVWKRLGHLCAPEHSLVRVIRPFTIGGDTKPYAEVYENVRRRAEYAEDSPYGTPVGTTIGSLTILSQIEVSFTGSHREDLP